MSESFPTDFSASDRLMWRIERDPVLRSPILAVGLLDRAPDDAAVHATLERAVARVPRLRQRVVASGLSGQRLRWEDDPSFSLDYHLRRVRAPMGMDLRSVLDLAAPWSTSTLDPARALWELTVVDGLEGGRAAFVLKFHHTITDGVGGVDLAGAVFDLDRSGAAPRETAPAAPAAGRSLLAQVTGLVRGGLATAARPTKAASDCLRLARSVGKLLEPAPAPLSPLLLGRGLDRHLDVLELPMGELRDAAHAVGATINDMFLAGLGGGLHDYHERLGRTVPALRVTMPVSVRADGDGPGGNHFTPVRFVLPIDEPDPGRRARIAGSISRRWRAEPAVGLTDLLARGLDLLPTSIVTPLFAGMLKNIDVDAVDVPGMQRPAYLGGARIDRMWAFAPPTGAALSITLLSHADAACIGVASDLAAVADPGLLRHCLLGAFEQVLALAPRPAVVHEEVGA